GFEIRYAVQADIKEIAAANQQCGCGFGGGRLRRRRWNRNYRWVGALLRKATNRQQRQCKQAQKKRFGFHNNSGEFGKDDQQRTIFDDPIPCVAFRVSTTSCASRTMAA